MRRFFSFAAVLSFSLLLAACDSAEDRAEGHFDSAVELLEQNDPDRAIVELRNVFQLVPNHLEARHLLARIFLEEKRNYQQAYSQYLRLVEQYPDDVKARTELAKLSFLSANWDELDRHGRRAIELAPEDPDVMIISTVLDYRDAIENEDEVARKQTVANATTLLETASSDRILREVILDDAVRDLNYTAALALLDQLTTDYPEDQRMWRQRLQVLIALEDEEGIEDQLVKLVAQFPDDIDQKTTLVRYYISRGELDKTEAFLRQLVADAPEGDTTARVDLIRFLTELRTMEEARAEIANAIETSSNPNVFITMGAVIDFGVGEQDRAISALEAAIDEVESSEDVNSMRVTLARMLLSTGNEVGARSQVETVLLDDPGQVGALKMNAAWLIEADDTDGAVGALRAALDAAPDDVEAMTLMASAYTRAGSPDLARDFLALAAEESGNAPEETIRYAQLLIREGRFIPAEDVLLPALRIAPNNINLLRTTGQLYLAMDDLGRLQQVIETLQRLETPEATQMAIQLETERLNRASGSEEALQYLEGLANTQEGDLASQILLLRARLSTGDNEGALDLAQRIADGQPDAPAAQLVLAATHKSIGDLESAMEIYMDLSAQYPEQVSLKLEISGLHTRMGNPDLARSTIAAALEDNPSNPGLLWAKASFQEEDGDIDGAIEVYEELYALNSDSIIVANNLASLIGAYRDDAESLDRAWTIARRFRDSRQPAIQDTYGWLTHRRGNSEDALPYLQSAAAGLPDDSIVQFHLAEVLFTLDRLEDALGYYRQTIEKAGIADTRPQIDAARARIIEIEASLAGDQ